MVTLYLRAIAQDSGSAHTCAAAREKWAQWQSQGLYLFFLPPYCSEMNRIEPEWHQLNAHELAGQMFEDELDLAYGVIDGVEARGNAHRYTTKRFRFNSESTS